MPVQPHSRAAAEIVGVSLSAAAHCSLPKQMVPHTVCLQPAGFRVAGCWHSSPRLVSDSQAPHISTATPSLFCTASAQDVPPICWQGTALHELTAGCKCKLSMCCPFVLVAPSCSATMICSLKVPAGAFILVKLCLGSTTLPSACRTFATGSSKQTGAHSHLTTSAGRSLSQANQSCLLPLLLSVSVSNSGRP